MMPLFRLRLEFAAHAVLATPLTSGTIFGHLCWAVRTDEGNAALEKWLERLPGEPFAVSDGFPEGLLPRLIVPPGAPKPQPPAPLDKNRLAALEREKQQRKLPFVPLDAWRNLRKRVTAAAINECAVPGTPWMTELLGGGQNRQLPTVAHNTIDRRSGHTPEEGGLYFSDDTFLQDRLRRVDVYVRTVWPPERVRALFGLIGENGYGRDASTGRGAFAVNAIEPAAELDEPPAHGGRQRMLSLSTGTVSANMRDARYRHTVHFGKVGKAMLSEVRGPWKLPLLLAAPGATFIPEGAGPFGEWLLGVHQDRRGIGHNAFHVAIPFAEAT